MSDSDNKLTVREDELIWGGAPVKVRLQRLCALPDAADFELRFETPIRPRWRTLKDNLYRLGFTRDQRHPRYDRFRLGSATCALTHDGRMIIRGIHPNTAQTALAAAALFLSADAPRKTTE